MIKVYIVYQAIDYEGGSVIAVYTDEQKAIDLAMSQHDYYYPYQVKEVELDTIFDLEI